MEFIDKYNKLVSSDAYVMVKSNGEGVSQPLAKDVIRHFMAALGIDNEDFTIKLDKPQINETINSRSVSYPRYLLQARIKDFTYGEGIYTHYGNVGLIVDAKTGKGVTYAGERAEACLNMMIFGGESVGKDNLDYILSSNVLQDKMQYLHKKHEEWCNTITMLRNRRHDKQQWHERIGELMEVAPTEILPYFTSAQRVLRDKDSIYYDMPLSDWRLFSALTDSIKNKGVMATVGHTEKVQKLFVNSSN